ncbi:hypothetical protein H6F74_07945 [Trichocoleus sp. FACHB-90]|nr:hypothetical protein [Trichocoleus sp. FACHB-90]
MGKREQQLLPLTNNLKTQQYNPNLVGKAVRLVRRLNPRLGQKGFLIIYFPSQEIGQVAFMMQKAIAFPLIMGL